MACSGVQAVASTFAFLLSHSIPNTPCLIKNATAGWRAAKDWVINGDINTKSLKELFGDALVSVSTCSSEQYGQCDLTSMKLSKFMNCLEEQSSEAPASNGVMLYLKDWHICREFPEYEAFQLPVFFSFDWLNEYWDQRSDVSDDFRFVYIGPAGSWTPFHVDVLRSYSWSVNICGQKEWLLVPPGQEQVLSDSQGSLPADISSTDKLARMPETVRVVQDAGDAIFVPSGWYHQVKNLQPTISINHNWCNACNVSSVWAYLREELVMAKNEVADMREVMDNWHHHCQLMLRVSSGMNYMELCEMLLVIAHPRYQCYQELKAELSHDPSQHGNPEDEGLGPPAKYSKKWYRNLLWSFCHQSWEKGTNHLGPEMCEGFPQHALAVLSKAKLQAYGTQMRQLSDMFALCCFELVKLFTVLCEVSECEDFRLCASDELKLEAQRFITTWTSHT